MKQMVGQLIGPFVPPGFDHVWSNPVPFLVQTVRPRQLSLAAALSPPLGRNTREVLTFIQNPVEIHWNLIESFKIHSKSIENPFKIHSKSIENPFKIHSKSIDMLNLWRAHRKSSRILLDLNVQNYFDEIWKNMERLVGFAKRIFACGWVCRLIDENRVEGSSLSSLQVVDKRQLRHRSCCLSVWCWTRQSGTWTAWTAHGSSPHFRSQLSGEYMENILAIACHSMSNEAWLWVLRIPSVFRAMNRPLSGGCLRWMPGAGSFRRSLLQGADQSFD